jgi:hypothetical protein
MSQMDADGFGEDDGRDSQSYAIIGAAMEVCPQPSDWHNRPTARAGTICGLIMHPSTHKHSRMNRVITGTSFICVYLRNLWINHAPFCL